MACQPLAVSCGLRSSPQSLIARLSQATARMQHRLARLDRLGLQLQTMLPHGGGGRVAGESRSTA